MVMDDGKDLFFLDDPEQERKQKEGPLSQVLECDSGGLDLRQ